MTPMELQAERTVRLREAPSPSTGLSFVGRLAQEPELLMDMTNTCPLHGSRTQPSAQLEELVTAYEFS